MVIGHIWSGFAPPFVSHLARPRFFYMLAGLTKVDFESYTFNRIEYKVLYKLATRANPSQGGDAKLRVSRLDGRAAEPGRMIYETAELPNQEAGCFLLLCML